MHAYHRRRLFAATLVTAAVLLPGCGGRDLTSVSGTVTYQGQPLEQGRVGFLPVNGRPSYGDIQDGQFKLSTYESGDGAASGSYRVLIQSDKLSDPADAFSNRISLIPNKYGDPETSGFTAEVKLGENNVFDFELVD